MPRRPSVCGGFCTGDGQSAAMTSRVRGRMGDLEEDTGVKHEECDHLGDHRGDTCSSPCLLTPPPLPLPPHDLPDRYVPASQPGWSALIIIAVQNVQNIYSKFLN